VSPASIRAARIWRPETMLLITRLYIRFWKRRHRPPCFILSGRPDAATALVRFRGTGVTEYWIETAASVGLDIGRADHLAPSLGFFGDQLAELDRRSRQRRSAEVSETGLHLGVVESRVDLFVELVDDLGRRGLRYAEAVPITPLVARQELTHGRDVRQRVRARRSGYCERTQAASPDVLDGRRHCSKAYLYLPREEIGQSRPCATIENVHHINTSHYFEKLAGHMHRRTKGPRAHVDLARATFGIGDKLWDGFGGERRM